MELSKIEKRLKLKISEIKANSKDPKFAETLISEVLSLKGQIDIEPAVVHLPIKDIEKEYDGGNFKITLFKDGTVNYHTYGGFDVTCKGGKFKCLNETLAEYVRVQDHIDMLTEDERDTFDLDLLATTSILNAPLIAFSDHEFKLKLSTMIVEFINSLSTKAVEEKLQDETPELDDSFKEASIALDSMSNIGPNGK